MRSMAKTLMGKAITSFTGEYRFLSNFWPCSITYEATDYPSVEHAFQAAKTLNQNERLLIRSLPSPAQAKRAGKKVVLRPDWEQTKVGIMRSLLHEKFSN